jgi:hypothetical protein
MSTLPISEAENAPGQEPRTARSDAPLLVCLPSLTADGLQIMRNRIAAALPGQPLLLATPDAIEEPDSSSNITMLNLSTATASDAGWALTASDYAAASHLAIEHNAAAVLILGAEALSLSDFGLLGLADAVLAGKTDLALPRYKTGPHDALLSSALLYPLTNALFGTKVHLPLPLDIAFSPRMATRFTVAHKPDAGTQGSSLLWPVSEAATFAFVVREVEAGERTLPQPTETDLNSLLAEIVGSLFNDIEAKASFWQRARPAIPARPNIQPTQVITEAEHLEDIREMAESFHNAYTNLQEIWSLVLPPQSLLGLKKVSRAPAEEFEMPPDLWARTVYDFVLAYHFRTINRGHLLGALTPIYLAWIASHLRRSAGDAALAAFHVEETAAAFVLEKPYIVARWRWPDRFNP